MSCIVFNVQKIKRIAAFMYSINFSIPTMFNNLLKLYAVNIKPTSASALFIDLLVEI